MAKVDSKTGEFKEYLSRMRIASPLGGILSRIIPPLFKGRYEYYTTYDDLRAPATTINLPGQPPDPTQDTDGSLLFSSTIENDIAVIMQLPHSWKVGSKISPHVHWCKTTNAVGSVVWQMRYRIVRNGGSTSSWTDWVTATVSAAGSAETDNRIHGFGDISLDGAGLSDILSFQVRRLPADANDNYDASARLWEFDIHYEKDSLGSFYPF
jgi:hypothetical protein